MSLILGARRSIEDYVYVLDYEFAVWILKATRRLWTLNINIVRYKEDIWTELTIVTILDPTWLSKTSDPWMIYSHTSAELDFTTTTLIRYRPIV
jgi:hypothetical protein